MLRAVFFTLVVGLGSFEAIGETAYVDDTLRVGIRNNPGSTEAAVEVVIAGAKLEVLDRRDSNVRVRTESGNEGWLGAGYIVAEAPARTRIQEVISERDLLRSELESLWQQHNAARDEQEQMGAAVGFLESENDRLRMELADLTRENNPYVWLYLGIAVVILFLFGVVLGQNRYKQRVRARLGGLAF